MKIFRFVAILLIMHTTALFAQSSNACEIDLSSLNNVRQLLININKNHRDNCYGESADTTEWVVEIRNDLAEIKAYNINSVGPVINASINKLNTQLLQEDPSSVAEYERLKQNMASIVQLVPVDFVKAPKMGLRANDWVYDQSLPGFTMGSDEKFNIKTTIETTCTNDANSWDDACKNQIMQVIKLLHYHGMMSGIVWAYNRVNGFEELKELELLDKQWEAYFYQAKPQNIAEVGFNSWRFSQNTKDLDGFLQPPSYQWIIVHPNIAMEYIDEAPDGQRFQESLILEVFGVNDWEWKGAKMEGPWGLSSPLGASVIASITDRANVDEVDWGVMFHIDHVYSFGVTFRDEHEGYFLSIDLLKFFDDWTEEQKGKFTSIKKDLEAKEAEFMRIKQEIETKKAEIESRVEEIKEKFAVQN